MVKAATPLDVKIGWCFCELFLITEFHPNELQYEKKLIASERITPIKKEQSGLNVLHNCKID
jgi:hypothetical protein